MRMGINERITALSPERRRLLALKLGLKVPAKNRAEKEEVLVAYYVEKNGRNPTEKDLHNYLVKKLPDYMIPSNFVRVEHIPLTPNGKIDRKALPSPGIIAGEKYVAPRDPIEETLAAIWSEVLEVEKGIIGIENNFFELGGHSLKATILVSKIYKEFQVRVPLIEIFKIRTIKKLSEYIKGAEKIIKIKKDENLVLLGEKTRRAGHVFLVHDGTGEVEGYINFCDHLKPDYSLWGIRADRIEDLTPRNITFREVAGKYIKKIEKVQPKGPYYIAGWSLGGSIAFEIVRQLEQVGEEIGFFAMIDTASPRGDSYKKNGKFTLKSELNFVESVLPEGDIKIKEKLGDVSDICEIWPLIVDYLTANNIDVERIKRLFPGYMSEAIPNFDRLNTGELIYYLNVTRTFYNAWESYYPSGKINAPIHFFRAARSKKIGKNPWEDFSRKPIKMYQVPGDHYSILKETPGVAKFARLFERAMDGTGHS